MVLAPPRSFTSVVSTMVGCHPQLYGLPELKLFAFPTIAELKASLPPSARARGIEHRSPGLVRAVAQVVFGDQRLTTLRQAYAWLEERSSWPGAAVFDQLQDWLKPRPVVEKSPENLDSDASLARLSSSYPAAWYLHLTRHPVTTVQSMYDHWCRAMGPAPGLGTACLEAWLELHGRITSFLATVPAGRQLRLRSEDVLNEPEPRLGAVAAWLGVATDKAALDAMSHPERSPFATFAADGSGVRGGHDPAFLTDPVPHRVHLPEDLDPPPGWGFDPARWHDVITLAEYLGYHACNHGRR